MSEILFRGKRIDNGDWVYGSLIDGIYGAVPVIVTLPSMDDDFTLDFEYDHVDPATLGQYTGLKDKNGKKVFEGDIIRKTNEGRHPQIFTANIRTNFRVNEEVYYSPCDHFTESCEYEIIGNIHDNSELLEV